MDVWRIRSFLLGQACFLVVAFFLMLSISRAAPLKPPLTVYRAVMEPPDVVKKTGGFIPRGADGSRPNQPPVDISLYNHATGSSTGLANVRSGYVATTTSLPTAHLWVNQNLSGSGYIYFIQPTGNMIDLNASLGIYSPHPGEMEYAALGIIHWTQVRGWRQVFFGRMLPYVPNPDYNDRLYTFSHAGEGHPELAGFPANHPAWSSLPWSAFAICDENVAAEDRKCFPKMTSERVGVYHFFRTDPINWINIF